MMGTSDARDTTVPDCEVHKYGRRCGEMTTTLEPEKWCRSCLVAEVHRLRPVEHAVQGYLLSLRGWEEWGSGHFLYDRLGGVGNGRVFTMIDALEWLGRQALARRRSKRIGNK